MTHLVLLKLKKPSKSQVSPLHLVPSPPFSFCSWFLYLAPANQLLSLSFTAQTKKSTDVRPKLCTMTPFQPSHCSCTHDNYSTLQPERGNYWEGCSSKSVKKEKREIRAGELCLYCLLREVVKQRPPNYGRMRDERCDEKIRRKDCARPCVCCVDKPKCSLQVLMRLPAPVGKMLAWVCCFFYPFFFFFLFLFIVWH